MINVSISNCNNITNGQIQIEDNKLNIKYGINGTGKSTISHAILCKASDEDLNVMQTYLKNDAPSVDIDTPLNKVLVFNEEFVNNIVFNDDEVINNSFEIFIKTPKYNQRKVSVESRLKELHDLMAETGDINLLYGRLMDLHGRFKINSDGSISRKGVMASLLLSNNIYNIPDELEGYKPFISNSEINIDWIDWKNKGNKFDTIDNCPYCAHELVASHKKENEIFKEFYKKTDSKNLKELVDLIESIKEYINDEKYASLMNQIKSDTASDILNKIISDLYSDIHLIIGRLEKIIEFGKKKIGVADISTLDDQLLEMSIPTDALCYFQSNKFLEICLNINEKVDVLKSQISVLKSEMGILKGVINDAIKESQKDINDFLQTAGINYEIQIIANDETDSKVVLKQCYSSDKTQVEEIKKHLSWGEKNAFSLILFMYYAVSQNPDLIILDDPISSFDKNKKFAILHRLFKKNVGKKDVSFSGRTVLLLTHDFEPITDFIIVGKLDGDYVTSSYIWNHSGVIQEKMINTDNDVKLVNIMAEEIARNDLVNPITRITFLRKLCELNGCLGVWKHAYDILSSLMHKGLDKPLVKTGQGAYIALVDDDLTAGMELIKLYIDDFNFSKIKNEIYNKKSLKNLYVDESNNYYKMQIFRAIREMTQCDNMDSIDEGWLKFIDETYHIENDYLHYLDIQKFDIVPDYVLSKVDNIIANI